MSGSSGKQLDASRPFRLSCTANSRQMSCSTSVSNWYGRKCTKTWVSGNFDRPLSLELADNATFQAVRFHLFEKPVYRAHELTNLSSEAKKKTVTVLCSCSPRPNRRPQARHHQPVSILAMSRFKTRRIAR